MSGFARFVGPEPVSFELIPYRGVDGDGPVYRATERPCWFTLKTDVPVSGGWVRIVYDTSLLETPERPVVRFEGHHDSTDHVLPAATFGRQSWIGFVPEGTTAVRVSPRSQIGWFGFRVAHVEQVSLARMLALAASRNVGRTALAVLTTALMMWTAQRINLRVAVTGTPLARYDDWRKANLRPIDPNSIDAIPTTRQPHIRVVVVNSGDALAEGPLVQSLQQQRYRHHSIVQAPPSIDDADIDVRQAVAADPELLKGLRSDDLIVAVPSDWCVQPTTLFAVANAAETEPDSPAFYGDDDEVSEDGRHHSPRFRTVYDPLLASTGFYNSIPMFWRVACLTAKPGAGQTPKPLSRILFTRGGSGGRVKRAARSSPPRGLGEARRLPLVSIIIPTRNNHRLLARCIDAVKASDWPEFEVIVVDNGSDEKASLTYLRSLESDRCFKIVRDDGPFNFSRLCNMGAYIAAGALLVFLNNDVIADDPLWIRSMAHHALQPDIGAVGMKLLFGNGRLQHIGAVAGLTGLVGHIDVGLEPSQAGLLERNLLDHRVGAVTGACLMIRRSLFWSQNGFNEEAYPIEYNDIDLCYRLAERGFSNVVVAHRHLTHLESYTRGKTAVNAYPLERRAFARDWNDMIRSDPYFHPALSLATHIPQLG